VGAILFRLRPPPPAAPQGKSNFFCREAAPPRALFFFEIRCRCRFQLGLATMKAAFSVVMGLLTPLGCHGHGQINYPPSTRQGLAGNTAPGSYDAGGFCQQPNSENPHNPLNGACMMFSQPSAKEPWASIIPGKVSNRSCCICQRTISVAITPDLCSPLSQPSTEESTEQ
jgi:hypothetical protein